MTRYLSSIFTVLSGGFLVLLVTLMASAQSDDDRMGAWLATLETPAGNLRLLVTVTYDEAGEQTAILESLDQAPGQDIPITSVMIDEDQFAFSIAAIGATFEGAWNPQTQGYEGVFRQGMEIPTRFSRPDQSQALLAPELNGVWEGALQRDDTRLEFTLEAESDETGTSLVLNSVTQGAYGIPITGLRQSGDGYAFNIPAANVTYEFDIAGNTLVGVWTRPGFDDADVRFERVSDEVTGPNRPQTPQAPFPYTEHEVRIDNPDAEGVTLAGTLTLPDGHGPFPGVILISGSGPQDRNESVWTHQPFAVLADYLTRQGIAVLRYDDRGFAESTGDFASATSFDFASDVQALVNWMQEHDSVSAVGLAGHSEGGLIAPIVAAQSADTAFVVLLAGPGTPGHQFIPDQIIANSAAMGADRDLTEQRVEIMQSLIDIVRNARDGDSAAAALDGMLTEERLATLEVPADQKETFVGSMSRDWYRTLVNYDPADWIPAMDQPVLALQGTLDLQIVAEPNVAGLEALLANNPDHDIVVLEGRNHLFQQAETGLISEYAQIEETMDPEVMAIMADWINARFGAER